jgi:hypothetical protein
MSLKTLPPNQSHLPRRPKIRPKAKDKKTCLVNTDVAVAKKSAKKSNPDNIESEKDDAIPSNNDANAAEMPDDQPNAKEPSLSTKASTERRPRLPLNTQPSTLVESEVAEMMVLARAKMKESESEIAKMMLSARAKMSSVTSKSPEMVPTAIER